MSIPRKLPLLLLICGVAGILPVPASAAIYWGGSDIGGAGLDGSNSDLHYIDEGIGEACGIAVDGRYLYWADLSLGQIGRANLDGTEPNPSFITGAAAPCGVAVTSEYIYWANRGGNSIGRARIDGTDVRQGFIGGMRVPCGVAVKDPFIYWASPHEDAVGRALVSDGSLAENEFIEGVDGACGVALTDSHLFWGSFLYSIGRAALDGTAIEQHFIGGLERPSGIAIHATQIYWAEERVSGAGAIGTATLNGGSANRALVTGLGTPNGIAVDAQPFPLDRSAHQPPSSFSFAKVRHGNRRDPATFFAIDVPAAGTYRAEVPRGTGWNAVSPGPYDGLFVSPGRHWFSLYLDGSRAARKLAKRIRNKGKIKVPVTFYYTAENHNETGLARSISLVGIRQKASREPRG